LMLTAKSKFSGKQSPRFWYKCIKYIFKGKHVILRCHNRAMVCWLLCANSFLNKKRDNQSMRAIGINSWNNAGLINCEM
jgi:hypothetical protein